MGTLTRAAGRIESLFQRAAPKRPTSTPLPRHIVQMITRALGADLGMQDRPKFDELEAYIYNAWVYAPAFRLAVCMAMPTMRVYKGDPEGRHVEVEPNHPLRLLLNNPNQAQSRFDLWEDIGLYLALKGEAPLLLDGMLTGATMAGLAQPKALWCLNPGRIEPKPGVDRFIESWEYTAENGRKTVYDGEEVLLIKWRNPRKDYRGLGHIAPAGDAVTVDEEAADYNREMFANRCEPGGYIQSESEEDILTQEQVRELIAGYEARHKGKFGRLGWLPPKHKWIQASQSPKDMQYAETRRFAREEILAAFGLPPVMVGIVETATYNNAKEQRGSFWEERMMPQLTKVAEALNSPVSGLSWRYGPDIFVRWDLSRIPALQEDRTARVARVQGMFDRGAATRNDLRLANGDEARPGLDDYYVASTYLPLGDDAADANASRGFARKSLRTVPLYRDKARRTAFWKLAMIRWQSWEPRWVREARFALEGQESRVLKRLSDAGHENVTPEQIFPMTEENERLAGALRDLATATVKAGGEAGLRQVIRARRDHVGGARKDDNAEDDFVFALDENVQRVTEVLVQKLAEQVNATTWEAVRGELLAGQQEGDSIREIRDRLRGVLEERRSDYELTRIARTEIGKCSNAGAMEGYRQSGVVEKTEWVATQDDRVRESHSDLDGDTTELGGAFKNGLAFPGDPNGPAEEVINCRCTTIPVIEVEE